jgi:hypothetical protein
MQTRKTPAVFFGGKNIFSSIRQQIFRGRQLNVSDWLVLSSLIILDGGAN